MEETKKPKKINFKFDQLKTKLSLFLLDDFFHNAIVQWSFLLALVINMANWIGIAYFIRPVDFPIILHYNAYFGVDIIGNWKEVYYLPTTGTIILIVNALLALYFFKRKQRIASHILLLAAMFVQAGVSIAAASVIIINY